MARPQFTRMESFPIKPSKGRKSGSKGSRKPSVAFVTNEPERRDRRFCKHIPRPMPPFMLVGSLQGMCKSIKEGAAKETDTAGRRQRCDAPVLIGAVSSYPDEWDQANPEDVFTWIVRSHYFYGRTFGNLYRAGLLHVDEAHPHLHHFIHDAGRNVKNFHPGYRAGETAYLTALAGGTGKRGANADRKKAFGGAMEKVLDRYYVAVGKPCGLDRKAPEPVMRTLYSETAMRRKLKEQCRSPERVAVGDANKASVTRMLEQFQKLELVAAPDGLHRLTEKALLALIDHVRLEYGVQGTTTVPSGARPRLRLRR